MLVSTQLLIISWVSLEVKVGQLGKHHHNITQLAFEDKSLRNDVSEMRKAENIHEMDDSSELLEFFYDENAGTSVLLCRASFEYHCLTSSRCKSMTPMQAQQKLNLHVNRTFSTGLFQSQAVTKFLIEGHNQTWYTQIKQDKVYNGPRDILFNEN